MTWQGLVVREGVPLGPRTTLELGGPARYFVDADDEKTLVDALRWARARDVAATVLGAGSNVVVADGGFEGLVVRLGLRGVALHRERDRALLTVQAGEPWDPLVAQVVSDGLAGLECLSGIPGLAGATPIQNVGAYGQEVSETLESVRVLCRHTLDIYDMTPEECRFAYRDSVFKRNPDRWVVLAVTFALRPGDAPAVRYSELSRALEHHGADPTLVQVRDTVLSLRRGKSMVIDPQDPNHRSVGSFFTNPVVTAAEAREVARRAVAYGMITDPGEMPRFEMDDGRVKLAAGWLVERAGIAKGMRRGPVGVSTRHALALVHHGGGTTGRLLELAREVRHAVHARFGVTLRPEPVMLGFRQSPL